MTNQLLTNGMAIHEARAITNRVVADWGMQPVTVTVNERFERLAGRAWVEKRLVELGVWAMTDKAFALETLLHEIAHILSADLGQDDGRHHGNGWKEVAEALDIEPKRCCGTEADDIHSAFFGSKPLTLYEYACPNCGRTLLRKLKFGKRWSACGICCKAYNYGRWTVRFKFVLMAKRVEQNGQVIQQLAYSRNA